MTNAELEELLIQIQEQTMLTQEHPQIRLDRICAIISDAGRADPAPPKPAEESRKSKR